MVGPPYSHLVKSSQKYFEMPPPDARAAFLLKCFLKSLEKSLQSNCEELVSWIAKKNFRPFCATMQTKAGYGSKNLQILKPCLSSTKLSNYNTELLSGNNSKFGTKIPSGKRVMALSTLGHCQLFIARPPIFFNIFLAMRGCSKKLIPASVDAAAILSTF